MTESVVLPPDFMVSIMTSFQPTPRRRAPETISTLLELLDDERFNEAVAGMEKRGGLRKAI